MNSEVDKGKNKEFMDKASVVESQVTYEPALGIKIDKEAYVIDTVTALKKGGSIQITIPKEVVDIMELNPGDQIMFVRNPKTESISIYKVAVLTSPTGLSFSISKKLAKKLLEKERKG